MLIAPVCTDAAPRICQVCRVGQSCAIVFHRHGAFLVCTFCCGNIAAALLVRVGFAADVPDLERFDPERLA